MHRLPVPALLGPTATGKTALALALAERLPLEIISLDSALVYRHMDIGTAKPTTAERRAVVHHLIDIIDPEDSYSAADFVADCTRLSSEIYRRGRLPLIVGGTMMYYHALQNGLNSLPEADPSTRAALQAEKAQYGLAALYRRLQQADPITAARLDSNDSQRIERALEVFQLTGIPLSRHLSENQAGCPALPLFGIALLPSDRQLLHQRIDQRFDQMIRQGLLDEVASLRRNRPQLNAGHPAMRTVGYRQAWLHLDGETDAATFRAQATAATRQLAKRQLTWLRKLHTNTQADPFSGSPTTLADHLADLIRNHCT